MVSVATWLQGGRADCLRDARRQRRVVGSVGQRPDRVIRRRSGVLDIDKQIREPMLDPLERSDRPTELQPGLRVFDRQVE